MFGPLIGAVLIVLLPEYLSSLAEYRLLFFGAVLLGVLWVAPGGVAGAIANRLRCPRHGARPATGIDVLSWLRQRTHDEVLRVEGLSLAFGGVRAVAEVSFTARSGQITSLIGPNGAGKTTVLNVLSGFYIPDGGVVTLGGQQVLDLPSHAIARLGIARTYQTSQLFPTLSVLENLLIALRQGKLGALLTVRGDVRDEIESVQLAVAVLTFVGYDGTLERAAGGLAHVDKRVVEIARALAMQPQVPPQPGQLRAGVHSDYGSLTILKTEDKPGGLQVYTKTGIWVDVPILAVCFLVNLGDLMGRWTNDQWVSTP